MVFLVLYVDDILLIGNDVETLSNVKKWLAEQFQMKDLMYFLWSILGKLLGFSVFLMLDTLTSISCHL